jgi:hypothetical protein
VSGEGVPALVLDGEHDVLGLIGQSKPAPLSPIFLYSRAIALSHDREVNRGSGLLDLDGYGSP